MMVLYFIIIYYFISSNGWRIKELKANHTRKIEKYIQFANTLQPYTIIVGCNEETDHDYFTNNESYTIIN
jgi:hypothetical protein